MTAGDTTLFDTAPDGDPGAAPAFDPSAPLAVRMRPRSLDEVVGQQHLLGPRAPLRRLVEADEPMSLVLYGPPGTGKTSLAHVISLATERSFVQLSALDAGVKEVRAVIAQAKRELTHAGRRTVLFIDEVHRFSKTQQDSLLSAVEDRIVSLIAATTENPFFSVVSPLLSRSLVLALQPLADDDVRAVLRRALASDRGLDGAVTLTADAEEHLLRVAGGDARKALTALESGAGAARAAGGDVLDLATLETAVAQAAVRYDRQGDQHYDVASALIKSIRGSDVDAALHYLARMVEAGEDPRFVARRLVIAASEDVGMADPTALLTAVAAADAVAFIGMPEGHFALAQAVVHLATAPKSNALTVAIGESVADVRAGLAGPVPAGLRDAHYAGARKLGHGATYRYPHDHPDGVLPQQYPPDALVGRDYYRPTARGVEAGLGARLGKLRAIVRRRG
ncbi:AAA family ATPase [Modestobacter sp. I12A-02628]|uniref:Replication-associated recombination protein A n=1 Tax=Goekera deserti TaxID=2497753 RepID=A0A7K3WAE6_9ACTN|nr:replication-associated recombination protein A [Goekera deserti]MPQ99168.1 AAA family ATPase [Goekera deserti]NDI47503.1 AAA family ATPase [Goekera deserti]NEL53314.1 replication-associated recombination protein A [Goekera deserti]